MSQGGDFFCEGTFGFVGAGTHIAVNFGELAVFEYRTDHAAGVHAAAVAGQKYFFFHIHSSVIQKPIGASSAQVGATVRS